jgi:propionyl-CoA synthetase
MPKWFADGEINITTNAIDRHIDAGRGDEPAMHQYSAYTGVERTYSFNQLREEVGRLASVMKKKFGVKAGDTVIIYMPMVPETAFAMLACARLGATHAVVFGGFAASELATRIDHCLPKMIITASMGIEPKRTIEYLPIVDEALSLCTRIENPS